VRGITAGALGRSVESKLKAADDEARKVCAGP